MIIEGFQLGLIILQALPFFKSGCQLVTERLHKVSSSRECDSGCKLCINQWILSGIMFIIIIFLLKDI